MFELKCYMKNKKNTINTKVFHSRQQTLGEEIANSITHGIGAALSIAALIILVVFAAKYGDVWRVVSFSVYGSTLFILYLVSTLYHSFTNRRVKSFFEILDHTRRILKK